MRAREFMIVVLLSTLLLAVQASSIIGYTENPLNIYESSKDQFTPTDNRPIIDFISINGNAHFHEVADQYNWPGSGMEWDPYIIEGYHFNNTYHMFVVAGTDLYWEFRDNIVDGVDERWCEIVISDLRNAKIYNNTFVRGAVGIHCIRVTDSMFVGNIMSEHSFDGVLLEYSHRNIIASNVFYNEREAGVLAWTDSSQNTIRNNFVYNAPYGFLLWQQANKNIIRSNVVRQTTLMGMDIQTDDNTIESNQIHHIEGDAICVSGSENSIRENLIYNNTGYGINAASSTILAVIQNNVFINCEGGAIQLHEASNCVVSENDLFENGVIQALDYGEGNVFDHNYWHEWLGNDTNGDNIIDTPKLIYGGSNTDEKPSVEPINSIPSWYTYEPITGPPEEPTTTTTSTTTTSTTSEVTSITTTSTQSTTSTSGFEISQVLGITGAGGALIILALVIMARQVKEP